MFIDGRWPFCISCLWPVATHNHNTHKRTPLSVIMLTITTGVRRWQSVESQAERATAPCLATTMAVEAGGTIASSLDATAIAFGVSVRIISGVILCGRTTGAGVLGCGGACDASVSHEGRSCFFCPAVARCGVTTGDSASSPGSLQKRVLLGPSGASAAANDEEEQDKGGARWPPAAAAAAVAVRSRLGRGTTQRRGRLLLGSLGADELSSSGS